MFWEARDVEGPVFTPILYQNEQMISKHVWAPYWTYCQPVPSAFVQHIKTGHAYLSRNS